MNEAVKCAFCGASGQHVTFFASSLEPDALYICGGCIENGYATLVRMQAERLAAKVIGRFLKVKGVLQCIKV